MVNLSGVSLSDDEVSVLRKGLNFVPTPTSVPVADFVSAVESVCRSDDVTPDVANRLRFEVTKALNSFRPPQSKNLSKGEWKALRDLQDRQDIMILPADKGRSVCVMTCEQYQSRLETLIGDHDTYTELDRDPTGRYTREVRGALKDLEQQGKLDRKTYLKLYPSDPTPPLLYGLPKVHKQGVPLRPIVSSIGSVTYQLSKHLASILSPLVGKSEHHVKDTASFKESLRDVTLSDDETMVSFDVKALFTSVPTEAACEVARQRLEEEFLDEESKVRAETALEVEDIIKLLRLCLGTTYFRVNGKFFKQKWGTAMGSPVSVVVAILFMESFESSALQSFPHPVKLWRRYVDDTFVILKKDQVGELLDHLNAQHERIEFTLEEEKEGSLPFLDVKVHRLGGGTMKTEVFRKATHTDKYLHYESHHSSQHKASVPQTLFTRASRLTTTPEDEERETGKIERALVRNHYPKRMVRRIHRRVKNRERLRMGEGGGSERVGREQEEDKRVYVSIPYIQGVSEQVTRVLRPYAKVSTRPAANLSARLVKPKDKLGIKEKAGLVYQYKCQCGEHVNSSMTCSQCTCM